MGFGAGVAGFAGVAGGVDAAGFGAAAGVVGTGVAFAAVAAGGGVTGGLGLASSADAVAAHKIAEKRVNVVFFMAGKLWEGAIYGHGVAELAELSVEEIWDRSFHIGR